MPFEAYNHPNIYNLASWAIVLVLAAAGLTVWRGSRS